MNEVLSNVLNKSVVLLLGILVGYIILLVHKFTTGLAVEAKKAENSELLWKVKSAVADAVSATAQSYVETLKTEGKFNKDAQREALNQALSMCLILLNQETQSILKAVYGDLIAYLTIKIEAELHNQKHFNK